MMELISIKAAECVECTAKQKFANLCFAITTSSTLDPQLQNETFTNDGCNDYVLATSASHIVATHFSSHRRSRNENCPTSGFLTGLQRTQNWQRQLWRHQVKYFTTRAIHLPSPPFQAFFWGLNLLFLVKPSTANSRGFCSLLALWHPE